MLEYFMSLRKKMGEQFKMQKTKSFRELKRMAKLQMQGKTGTLIGAMFLYLLINLVLTEVVAKVIPNNGLSGEIILHVVSYIIELILATLVAGIAYLSLNVACHNECKVSDLFYVAKNHPDKAIKIQAVILAINIVLSIPSLLYNYNYGYKFLNYYTDLMDSIISNPYSTEIPYASMDLLQIMGITAPTLMIYFVLSMVCVVALAVITLGFFPAFYLMLDFPQMEPMDVLKKSWELMKGYKLRLFLLQLSFIGHMILSVFLFCIPLIWLIPYMQMTRTNFYLDLISVKNGTENEVSVEV